MCGRFAMFSDKNQIKRHFDVSVDVELNQRYNISPGQNIVVLIGDKNSQSINAIEVVWGLKPKWGDNKSKLIINARVETVHEKNTFKNAFKSRRCVFIANGWYEWLRQENHKQPYYFSRGDSRLLAFAGLLSSPKAGELQEAIVLTRPAPTAFSFVHQRSPLLLTRQQVVHWLSDKSFLQVSEQAINEFDVKTISCHPVSFKVNNARNDFEDLICEDNSL